MASDPRITEDAVEAATRSLAKTFVTNKPSAGSKDFRVDARAALEAALPYLAPQPVDRAALEAILWQHQVGRHLPSAESLVGYRAVIADAVLALIKGSAS